MKNLTTYKLNGIISYDPSKELANWPNWPTGFGIRTVTSGLNFSKAPKTTSSSKALAKAKPKSTQRLRFRRSYGKNPAKRTELGGGGWCRSFFCFGPTNPFFDGCLVGLNLGELFNREVLLNWIFCWRKPMKKCIIRP